ncbi:venom serine carboxypeptidase-like [Ornithodoros turicata]|uniref:venom serine carboxypeptidase-like n=1 Tax=Ornithodoros turicata TaxID=34597 RepID=UPI003138B6DC
MNNTTLMFVLLSAIVLTQTLDAYLMETTDDERDYDDLPLFLTPLIQENRLEEARMESRVGRLTESFGVTHAYSGYITVDQLKGSNLFFFLVKSKNAKPNSPLILWLQGGPGQSSLLTALLENGPIGVDKHGALYKRAVNLQDDYDVLYLDEPVGAGYSFTMNLTHGFPRSLEDMAVAMEDFLRQFLCLFAEYNERDFYVSGESYGVRPAAALAVRIHRLAQEGNPLSLNLNGVMLGVGFFREIQQQKDVSEYYLQLGLIDLRDYVELKRRIQELNRRMQNNTMSPSTAVLYFDTFRSTSDFANPSFFNKITSFTYDSNALQATPPPEFAQFNSLMNSDWFKKSVHVGTAAGFRQSDVLILQNLASDLFRNISNELEFLLRIRCRVVVYAGQVDMTFPIVKTQEFLLKLRWPEAEKFHSAARQPWWGDAVDEDFAGYVTDGGHLRFVTLRFTGHYPFFDQPRDAHEIIRAFVENRSLLTKVIDANTGRYTLPHQSTGVKVSDFRSRNSRYRSGFEHQSPSSSGFDL